MKKRFPANNWIIPEPVLIVGTYDENGQADAMNAAWGGTYDDKLIYVSLSAHKTTENFMKTKAFSLAFGTRKTAVISDYVGIVSLNDVLDKMEKAGLHDHPSGKVNAPIFDEYPLTMECEVVSFEEGNLIGKIVGILADEEILTDGKIDIDKLEPIAYDPITHQYRVVKEAVAPAFKAGLALK